MFFLGLFIGAAIGCVLMASIFIDDSTEENACMDEEDEYYKE